MAGTRSHLSMQLQEAGIDMDLINQVLKLKEIESLVEKGKVKQETYENLVDDVLKGQFREQEAAAAPAAPNKNMIGKLRNIISSGSAHKTMRNPPNNPPRKVSGNMRKQPAGTQRRQLAEFGGAEQRKEIFRDELMRLGMDKAGNPVWRKVKVILFDDTLEYFILGRRGEQKNKKVIHLSDEFFVVNEVNKKQLKQAHLGAIDTEDGDDVFGQPHLFLLSDTSERFYFAAEDEDKKQFWFSVLVETLRGIRDRRQSVARGMMGGKPKTREIVDRYKKVKDKYVTDQFRKTMRMSKVGDFQDVKRFEKQEARWQKKGENLARRSVAIDWKKQELERVQQQLQDQDLLKEQLKQKEEALEAIQHQMQQKDEEWQKKYDDLLQKMREEAQARNEERREEQAKLEETIKEMSDRARSPSFIEMNGGNDDRLKEFEEQLEIYKTKLKALESALNVDMSNLDWDGTLDDAEKKMQALVADLMCDDEAVQREAQAQFDQWDNIIRNHADFKNREFKKWEDWETENKEKNAAALVEMKQKYVPQNFLTGISMQELISKTGITNKTAKRIMANRIFRFFWMTQDQIARIHVADLLNNYASQGLDIRELRAVYATLPKNFMMDNDGRKQQFRDNLRNRLFELSNKEKNNTLNSQEKLNNAYRDHNVSDKPKKAPGAPRAPPRKKNQAMKAKAMALQGLLEGKKNAGPSSPKKAPPAGAPKPRAAQNRLNSNDPEWKVYFNMEKSGLPAGAIQNRMTKDGKDPSLWPKLQELKIMQDNGGGVEKPKTESSQPPKSPARPIPKLPPQAPPQKKLSVNKGKSTLREMKSLFKEKPSSRKSTKTGKKAKLPKRKQRGSSVAVDSTVTDGPKRKSKNTLRGRKKSGRASMIPGDNAKSLVSKAQLNYSGMDLNGNNSARGRNIANLDNYGSSTKSQARAKKIGNAVDSGVQELVDIITEEGVFDVAEGGVKTMKFGDLFERYESISDMLVGLLLKAKRQGLVKYRGDMLFKGIHDEIKVTVQ